MTKGSIYLILICATAGLGGFLFGFDTAIINGALPFFREYYKPSAALEGWAVSSAIFGCIIGSLTAGIPADRYGRRFTLRILALLFGISAIGSGVTDNIYIFMVYRIIGGLAIGGASVLSPIYISEVAPPAYRGRLTVIFQLSIVIGILAAFAVDLALIDVGVNNWRWMFISGCIPAVIFLVCLYFVSESPRWLATKGKYDQAASVLQRIDPQNNVMQVLEDMKLSSRQKPLHSFDQLFRPPYLRLMLIGAAVGMFNQFTGISIVMIYSSDMFRAAGFSTTSAIEQTILVGFVNLFFTVVAMLLIDKIGRKLMLLIGALGMTISLSIISFVYFFDIHGIMPLVCMIIFVAFFAFSQGAVIWVLLAEMYPNSIRAKGSAMGSFSHWIFYAILLFVFPVLQNHFVDNRGIAYVFAFFSLLTFISFFFFKKFIVETKGKSLEEM